MPQSTNQAGHFQSPQDVLELNSTSAATNSISSLLAQQSASLLLPKGVWSQLKYQGADGAAYRARKTALTDAQNQAQLARSRAAELRERLQELEQEQMGAAAKMSTPKKKGTKDQLTALREQSLRADQAEAELARQALSAHFEARQARHRRAVAIAVGLHLQQPSQQRRALLTRLLAEKGRSLPLYTGSSPPPPLVGAIPLADPEDYLAQVGDLVAACTCPPGGGQHEPWILGEVVHYDAGRQLYAVDDLDNDDDDEGDKEGATAPVDRHLLSRRRVVPLPRYRADPHAHPEALFPAGTRVLALYPQTTCLYRAQVHSPPATASAPYRLLFEDSTCEGGLAPPPPLEVCQRYVIAYRELPVL
ncbi:hypothetical protein TYRP_023104 [Tyrophagus putrescentiae]|nr:hypothetical protein TYRP_023104 [Tyrophagus putrescentiae]